MSDLQSWHFKRDIPFKCWWHNTTIRLQGGTKFPKAEKPRGLHFKKMLQDTCLYKSWGHVRAVWLWWWTLADSAEKTGICAWARQEGAREGGLRRSSPSAPSGSALCHRDLSWASTGLKGPGLWGAWKNRQMVDHLRDNHLWLLAVLTCSRFIPRK